MLSQIFSSHENEAVNRVFHFPEHLLNIQVVVWVQVHEYYTSGDQVSAW